MFNYLIPFFILVTVMPYDPNRHHRRSIRLKDYDYRLTGAYFVTICTQDRVCILEPPPVVEMVWHWWHELEAKFPAAGLDAFVVMPNHVHGLVVLNPPHGETASESLAQVVQWFKTMTTDAYIQGVKGAGWAPFRGRVWQRNYYEHIVRNDREMVAIRYYIEANPDNWVEDEHHPARFR